jgi:CHASE3 domain sensor protein
MTNQTLSVRGFVISEDDKYIKQYEAAKKKFNDMLKKLQTSSNSSKGHEMASNIDKTNRQ